MRSAWAIPTLAALGLAIASAQSIDIHGVEAAPKPVYVTAPVDVVMNTPNVRSKISAGNRKRTIGRRDGNCLPEPVGYGPVATPDTVEAFLALESLKIMAAQAPSPDGYTSIFTNADASLMAANYMGLHTIQSYDTLGCASLCDQASGCQAFNMYAERDPTINPNLMNCSNPPSLTQYKCTIWGVPVSKGEAVNTGQYRARFQVAITASNAYNKNSPPAPVAGWTGPTELGGAINAPPESNTYMGYQYFPFSQTQGYTPTTCGTACKSKTRYNSQHPAADGSFQSCTFFNAYVLSKNGIPLGLYCSMYSQAWAPSYGINYGQDRDIDRYTVSESYSYSVNAPTRGRLSL